MCMICILILGSSSSFLNLSAQTVTPIDVSSTSDWTGFMNVFENNAGTQGGYLFGNNWATADLPASFTGETVSLAPNTNGYADSLSGSNDDRAYWTNSVDGGATAGLDGNKFMEATFKREAAGNPWVGNTVSFSGTIASFDLDSRYTATAFIKYLDIDDGFSTVETASHSITSTGDFTLTLAIPQGNYVPQLGITMIGLNANPDTDWGGIDINNLDAYFVVPEPSTYALLMGLVAFLSIAIRRRKLGWN